MLDISEQSDIKQAEESIAKLTFEISRLRDQVQRVVDLLVDTPSQALKERLQKVEAQIAEKETSRKKQEAKLEELRQNHRDLLDASVAFTELSHTKNFETRARLRQEIRRKVKRINCYFDRQFPRKKIIWRGPGEVPVIEDVKPLPNEINVVIQFVNGAVRGITFTKEGIELVVASPQITVTQTPEGLRIKDASGAPITLPVQTNPAYRLRFFWQWFATNRESWRAAKEFPERLTSIPLA